MENSQEINQKLKTEKTERKSEIFNLLKKIDNLITQKEQIWKGIEKLELYLTKKQDKIEEGFASEFVKDVNTVLDCQKEMQNKTEEQLRNLLEELKKIDPESAKEMELLAFVSGHKMH